MISSDPHLTAYIRVLLKEQRQNLAVGYFNKAVKHLAEYVLQFETLTVYIELTIH